VAPVATPVIEEKLKKQSNIIKKSIFKQKKTNIK
jgi:hypothetical protein